MAVVVAEGRTTKDADGKVKRQARYKFDKKFETFIAGKLAAETGAEVEATVIGASHGRDGVVHRLSRLIVNGSAVDDQGREVKTVLDARSLADDWRKALASRQARDAMHLVMSAKSGTDATAFRETAREVLASEFAGHEYFFAVHSDRGHLHAHAVILIKGADGQRIRPIPSARATGGLCAPL
jgi:type IV secretion system T-DNA border endonuclease VirD2